MRTPRDFNPRSTPHNPRSTPQSGASAAPPNAVQNSTGEDAQSHRRSRRTNNLTLAEQARVEGGRFASALQANTRGISNHQYLESQLNHWVNDTDAGEQRDREIAKDRILIAVRENADALDLSRLNISSLPPETGSLTHLKHLRCNNTRLTALPDTIGNLTRLERLDCHYTGLTSLPATIGNLKELTSLSCGSTRLTAVPDTIGDLTNLMLINCSQTGLTSFPNIRNLDLLYNLDLSRCQLPNIDLRSLPDNPELTVHLNNNRFSSDITSALVQAQSAGNYRGPRLQLSINERPIAVVLTGQHIDQPLAALGYPNPVDFAALREAIRPRNDMGDVANDFTSLLAKINNLATRQNGQLVGSIKRHIDNVLHTLDRLYQGINDMAISAQGKEQIKAIIESILAEAADANSSCVDRALVHLLKMSVKCSLNNATTPESTYAIAQDMTCISETMNFIGRLNSISNDKLVYDNYYCNFAPFTNNSGNFTSIHISDEIEDILVLLNSGLLIATEKIEMNYAACATLSSMDRARGSGHSLIEAAKAYIDQQSVIIR